MSLNAFADAMLALGNWFDSVYVGSDAVTVTINFKDPEVARQVSETIMRSLAIEPWKDARILQAGFAPIYGVTLNITSNNGKT